MASGLYEPTNSFLHRADPVTKILVLTSSFLLVLLLTRPAALMAMALAVAILAAGTGLSRMVARFGRFMVTFFLMCTVLWALVSRASSHLEWSSGLARGAWLGLRLVILLALGLIFLASTRVEHIAAGLHRLGLPFIAAFSLTLSFRLLPLFTASARTVVQAQSCRGVDLRGGGMIGRLRRYTPIMIPLVLSSLRSADGLAVALESRGLGMGRSRTSVLESRPSLVEWVVVVVSASAVVLAIAMRAAGAAL